MGIKIQLMVGQAGHNKGVRFNGHLRVNVVGRSIWIWRLPGVPGPLEQNRQSLSARDLSRWAVLFVSPTNGSLAIGYHGFG
jgi:hypothetical protein